MIKALEYPDNPARQFVRKLVVDEQWIYERSSRDYTILSALGRLCPNLMIIESNKPTREFYKELLNLRQEGHLSRVEHISEPNHSHTRNYYKTTMAFKDTLVELLVSRDLNIDIRQTGSIKAAFKIAEYLGEFKCLKRLHFDLAQDVALHRIEDLLSLCSNTSMLEAVKVTMAIKKEEETFDSDCTDVHGLSRLPSVKKFTLINREHLSNQDMVYIMHKFPGLKHLHFTTEGHYSEESENECYTTEVVQQFSRYMSQLDRCHLSLFKAAPALILDAITQLSRGFKVDDLLVHASELVDDEKCGYLNILEPTQMQRMSHTIHLILPTLHVGPLYQTALEAFAPQIKKLQIYGTMNPKGTRTNTSSISNVQIATNRILSESVSFVSSNFTRLRKLYLYNLIISTRSSTEMMRNTRLHLDDLYIYQCALNPQTLHRFSHCLDYVRRFRLEDVAFWIRDDLTMVDDQKSCEIDMPYTAFDTIFLPDDHPADVILVKVWTDTTTKHFLHRRNHDGGNEVAEQDYNEIKALDGNTQSIHVKCRKCTAIDFGCCRFLIRN
ncbi:hypothetical protein MAM1_0080d04504 [Mucor ambiguus]|uniref:F-box domain-containing protein n=1 Tax=Mucor ambiguus TaxID=91626 RepID=A0A0C9LUH5_9FUNG|nr:hypothetical protein MAM1_0080d04504 [Mucor ambiguus]